MMEKMENKDFFNSSEGFCRLMTQQGDSYTTGTALGLKCLIVSELCKKLEKKGLIICEDEIKARQFAHCLSFACENVCYYPGKDILFYSQDIRSSDITKKRFAVIDALFNGKADIVVASAEALLDKLVQPEILKKSIIRLAEGEEIDPKALSMQLVYMGYERSSQVEGAGQFSIRGGIIDIFSPNNNSPVRIELWGDEIDTIRIIDAYSQRSVGQIKDIYVYPFRELVFGEKELKKAAKAIEAENKALADRLRAEKSFGGIEKYIDYFYDKTADFFDYLDKDTIVFFSEENHIRVAWENIYNEFVENVVGRLEKKEALSKETGLVCDPKSIFESSKRFRRIFLDEFYDREESTPIDFGSKAIKGYGRDYGELVGTIKEYLKRKYRVQVFASSTRKCESIAEILVDEGISICKNKAPDEGIVSISRGVLPSFEFREGRFVVLNESGNTGKKQKKRKKSSKDAVRLSGYSDLVPGDYVVHENHGIGVYRGIEQIESDGFLKDYLCLEYANGGKLYVCVNQMDLVQKYIGAEAEKVKINSLGGVSWSRTKAKARTAVKELAFDLVKLYGKRQIKKGYKYSPDTVWQSEFEESFPYEETEDQLEAVADIKRDMESGKIMDRLICGDVGYGKTEVALRAAFKAINDSRQVAFLVPTTILANQHYMNIKERFSSYPIRAEMLSRFRTPLQQKQIIKELKSGGIDLVVGTHRLLSKDIEFKDLGLVIVDEEQRFGVGHKEKLKTLTEDVDVLTLSATPIPRTLHMSLSGIRDMSVLNEPPEDRLPVQTYVMEYNESAVRTAVMRELSRGGQVYYLHNRVQNIDETARKLRELIPEAKIGVGHGQMKERELENVLNSFLEREIDMLVCTTIIETGMDIQNVNTIIIENADYMGLSQLYQLRGRVGRTNRQAYCYLMYRKNSIPNEVSEKRLKTIKEFTQFGSGFKIALRDLEIRGAGDLLGANQHGHMDRIGYDMYCRILDNAVKELKGEKNEETAETQIDISVNAYIPGNYIEDEAQRLEIYKKIACINDKDDYNDTADELVDRFGDFPQAVTNLMDIAMMKKKASELKISSITGHGESIVIAFAEGAKPDPTVILELIKKNRGRLQLTTAKETYLTYRTETKGTPLIEELCGLLDSICRQSVQRVDF